MLIATKLKDKRTVHRCFAALPVSLRLLVLELSVGEVGVAKSPVLPGKTNVIQVGESGEHSVTFSQIGSGAHTFNSWCFILSWYILYNKSFKCPIGVPVASQLVLTLESVICRCIIWQNLSHIRGIVSVTGRGTFCQWWDTTFYHRTTFSSLECCISVCSIHPRQFIICIENDTRFDSGTEYSHVLYHASGIFLAISS